MRNLHNNYNNCCIASHETGKLQENMGKDEYSSLNMDEYSSRNMDEYSSRNMEGEDCFPR